MRAVSRFLYSVTHQTLTWTGWWGSTRAVAVVVAVAAAVVVAPDSPIASFSEVMAMGHRSAGQTLVNTLPFCAWHRPALGDWRPDCVGRRFALLVKDGSEKKKIDFTLFNWTKPRSRSMLHYLSDPRVNPSNRIWGILAKLNP